MLFPDSAALVASLSAAAAASTSEVEGLVKMVSGAVSTAIADRHRIREEVGRVLQIGTERVRPSLQEILGAWSTVAWL